MNAGQEIEISAAKTTELDAIIGLVSEVFQLPLAAARAIFFADPYFDLENKRVLRVGGRMVSCLTIIETACWIGQGTVKLAGIAGVTTRRDERRKGYAGCLLQATLGTLRERGFALSALMPFSFDYYRRFGYEQAAFAHHYLTAPQYLPLFPECRHIRAATREDLPHFLRLYDAYSMGRALYCTRDTKRWRYLFDHVKQRAVFDQNGSVDGYLLYEYRSSTLPNEQPVASDNTLLPPTLRVLEMYAATEQAQRGLVGYLAQQTNMGCIEYDARLDDLHHNGLLHPIAADAPALASIEIRPAVMACILDFYKMVEVLSANWYDFGGQIVLALKDDTWTDGGASVLIQGEGGNIALRDVTTDEARMHLDQLSGDVRVWSQVVVGYLSGGDAVALGKLYASTPRAATFAAQRFPRREPFLPAPDYF